MKCYEQDLNADKADGFIGHPIESRLHLCFVADKAKSWVCNNDWSLVWVAVPWCLLDSWPSANESGSFEIPEIFRLWVQKPPAAPNAICPQTQCRTTHQIRRVCKYACMFTMESCFRLCGVRGNMCDHSMSGCSLCGRKWGFILQWLFQAEQGMGRRCRGRKRRRKRRETNFVRFQHLAESLHTKACYSEPVGVKSAISRY